MRKKTILEIICSLFILLFAYAAISKLLDYKNLLFQFKQSSVLLPFAKVAWLLPGVELFTALLLCIPSLRTPGLYLSLLLMVVFTAYVTGIILFSKHLPCSCGGVLKLLGWKSHLVFNIFFIALAILGIRLQRLRTLYQAAAKQLK